MLPSLDLGLSRTSDKAAEVLLYFFYGLYPWSTKKYENGVDGKRKPTEDVIRDKPLVFFFHKKLISVAEVTVLQKYRGVLLQVHQGLQEQGGSVEGIPY